ncbi:ATP-dependent RNA helicase RhlB [Gammaproteobacteria bacterium LSUCC0057]|uniref:ATP-dependent RNA helicase RhlB n=1 Tax=Gammaproteobacteria bacterium LSUCC0057 TaxID=2559237 RepID=A0A4Y8UIR4_9GAMM|nr:ATP-dependent RNA helicase RhlB [Gammaproteobacteria bacterium LSUCC0057]
MTDSTPSSAPATHSTQSTHSEGNQRRRRSRGRRRSGSDNRSSSGWSLDQFVVPEQPGKLRFHDFSLPDSLMRGIQATGFEYCTPIQAASLPHTLHGHDIVGKAQTGTGKTAAFLLSIITDLINHKVDEPRYAGEARSLILAPTRELAVQIADDAEKLVKFTDLKVHCLVGGMDYQKQLRKVQAEHADIVVGTPGRLIDFATNRDLYLDQVEALVIDEADRMLDMGFIPQVRRLVRMTPKREDRQTMLFSATFTSDVLRLAEQWTDKPAKVEMQAERVATDSVEQKVYITTAEEKYTLLQNILSGDDVDSVMVFANRRDICRRLHERLVKQGFRVGILSGDIPQNKRSRTLEEFKAGRVKVMVATDVAGRGIHVNGVSHVVNFTLPEEPEDYVHRIGRTGRAGKTGTSISFACEDDAVLLEPIEALLAMKLPCTMPEPELLVAPTNRSRSRKGSHPDSDNSAAAPQPSPEAQSQPSASDSPEAAPAATSA